jgi:hypothetical protein
MTGIMQPTPRSGRPVLEPFSWRRLNRGEGCIRREERS